MVNTVEPQLPARRLENMNGLRMRSSPRLSRTAAAVAANLLSRVRLG